MVKITSREIGFGNPCFIIAEAGVNHNGDLGLALRLVDAALNAGADAVKFQTFKAEALVSPLAPKADYQMQTTSSSESQFDMIKRLEMSAEMHHRIMEYCLGSGILFMSSPFDESSASFLDDMGVQVFKIPSGEITNIPMLHHIAKLKKPMIVSTGMSYLGEVESAVQAIWSCNNQDIVLLHCVSDYPANPVDANLLAMHTMEKAFNIPIGYSDHTDGIDVTLAAVALGAAVIEKHITLDRTLPGPDHRASIEAKEFAELVNSIRRVESAIGHGRKIPTNSEANTAAVARKSIVAKVDITAETQITKDMLVMLRPGTGLPPYMMSQLIGRRSRVFIPIGSVITIDMLE